MSWNIKEGFLPQKWMGKKYILLNSGGDVMLIMNGKYLKLSIGWKNITAFE